MFGLYTGNCMERQFYNYTASIADAALHSKRGID